MCVVCVCVCVPVRVCVCGVCVCVCVCVCGVWCARVCVCVCGVRVCACVCVHRVELPLLFGDGELLSDQRQLRLHACMHMHIAGRQLRLHACMHIAACIRTCALVSVSRELCPHAAVFMFYGSRIEV